MDIKKVLDWRYSTKEFDPNKKVSAADFEQVKALLRMSPSSTNLQPWHFIIASDDAGKARVAKGTEGFFQFNDSKITKASHVIVFCSRTSADEDYMLHIIDTEDIDGRYPNKEVKERMHGARNMFANIHKDQLNDLQHWMEKQVYLNIGNFLLGVAALGIDAVPMEGIDMKAIDAEFGLVEKGFASICVVSIGYRAEGDFNTPSKTPKSRLPESEIFTLL